MGVYLSIESEDKVIYYDKDVYRFFDTVLRFLDLDYSITDCEDYFSYYYLNREQTNLLRNSTLEQFKEVFGEDGENKYDNLHDFLSYYLTKDYDRIYLQQEF